MTVVAASTLARWLPERGPERWGTAVIAATVLAFALWGWFAPLHGAVVAEGVVKTVTNRKAVQHMEGGLVKRIHVRNGDAVQQGQPLIELEDVRLDANQQLLASLAALEAAKLARLDAEQQFATHFGPPAASPLAEKAVVDQAYERELKIFRTRRELLETQLASFARQLQSVEQEQQALRDQMEASLKGAKLAKDELDLHEALVRDKFISRQRLIALERTVADYDAKRSEHQALLAQSEQRRNDLQLRMASIRNDYQRAAAEDHKESSRQLIQLREQMRPAQDAARRQTLGAPVSGRVVGMRLNAAGEVAPAKEALLEIVQDNEDLVVEARVPLDAIRDLRVGQATELRFTTFNPRTTPPVLGELTYVSADAIAGRDGGLSYVVQVRPKPEALRAAGIQGLVPGMAAEVFVLLQRRSVYDYLTAPISEVARRSFRER